MKPSTDPSARALETRIQSLLDGTISEAEFQHLEDELIANPEARKVYYEYAALQQGLEFRLSRSVTAPGAAGLADARLQRQRSRSLRYAVISAAALVIVSLIAMRLFFISPDKNAPPTIRFETSPGTLFTLTHDEDREDHPQGMQLDVESRLKITQGSVELDFSSGVRAIIQGPADITLHDHDKLYMDSGTGWFRVPEGAEGFTVVTRELNIIDLGTEFGVISDPLKDDEIHVFEGKVHVEALHGVRKDSMLTSNEAVRVRPYGRFNQTEPMPSAFPKQLPKALPHLHWSFDDNEKLLASNTIVGAAGMDYQLHSNANPSRSVHFGQGVYGKALALDGIGSYLETDWPGVLGNAPRSVAFWLKMPGRRSKETIPQHQNTIIGWGTQQAGSSDNLIINSKWTIHFDYAVNKPPMLNISFGGIWYFAPGTELDDNRWHHIAVTYSGESDQAGQPVTQLYIDGIAHPVRPAWHSPVRTHEDGQVIIDTMEQTPLVIGASLSRRPQELIRPNHFLEAQIDELYIIEGVIDEATVRRLKKTNQLSH